MTRIKVIFCWLSLLVTSQAMSQHSECNLMEQVIQYRHDFRICVCSNTLYIKCSLNGANLTSKELSTDEERCYKKLVESTNTRNKKTCVCSKLEECHSQEQLAHYKVACAEAIKSIAQILSYFKTLCCDLQNALLKLWLRLEEKTYLQLVKSISYGSLDANTVSAKLRRTEWCKASHAECLRIDAVLRKGCTSRTRHQGRQKRYIEQPTENYQTDIAASSTVTTNTVQEDIRQNGIVSKEMAENSSAQTRISKPFSTRTTMTESTVETLIEKNSERQMLSLSFSWPMPSSLLSSSSSSSSSQRKAGPLLSSSLISTSYFPQTQRHLSLSSVERSASTRNQHNSERSETTLVSTTAVTTFPNDQVATRVMLARLTSSTVSSPSSPEPTSTYKSASLLLEGSPSRSFPASGTSKSSSSLPTPRHSFLGHTMMNNEPSKAHSMSPKEPIAETISTAILNTKPLFTHYLIEEREDITQPKQNNVTGTRFVKHSSASISETKVLKTSSVDIYRLFESSNTDSSPTTNLDFHRTNPISVSTFEVDAAPSFDSKTTGYRMKPSISIFTGSSSIIGSKALYEAHVDPTYNSRTIIDKRKTLAIIPSKIAINLRFSMVLTTFSSHSVTDKSSVVTDKRISNVSFPTTQKVFHKEMGDLSVSATDFSVTMAKQTHEQLSINISQRSNIVMKPTSQTTLTSRSSTLLSPTSGSQMETTTSSFIMVTKNIERNGLYPATVMSVSKLVLRPSSSLLIAPLAPSKVSSPSPSNSLSPSSSPSPSLSLSPSPSSSSLAPSKVTSSSQSKSLSSSSSPSPSLSLSPSPSSSSLAPSKVTSSSQSKSLSSSSSPSLSLSPSSSSLAPSKLSSPSPSTSLSSSSSPSLSLSPSLSSLSSLSPSKVTSPLSSTSLSPLLISTFDASSLSMLIPSTSIQLSKSTAIPLSLLPPPSSSSLVSSTSPLPTHPSPTETLPSLPPLSLLTSSPPQKLFFTRQLSLSTSLNSSIFKLEPATRKAKLLATNLSSTLPLFSLYRNSTKVTSNETSSKLLTLSTATTSMIEMKPYSLTDTIRNDFSSLNITSVIYSSMATNQTPSLEQKYRALSFSFSSISSFIQTVSTKSQVAMSSLSSSEADQLHSISMSSTITTKASMLPFLPAALTTLELTPSSSSSSISVPSAMMTTSLSLNPSISPSFPSSTSSLFSNFTASSSMSTKPSFLIISLFSSSLMPYSTSSSLTPSLSILLSVTSSSSLQSSLSLTPISFSLISSSPSSLPSPSSSWIPSQLSSSRLSLVLFPLTSSSIQPSPSSISLASSLLMPSASLLSLPLTPDLSSLASSSFSSLTSSSMSSLTSSMSSPPLLTFPLMSSSLLLPFQPPASSPLMPSSLFLPSTSSSLMPSSILVTTIKQQLSENYTAVKTVMPSRTLPIQQSSSPLPSGASTSSLMPSSALLTTVKQQLYENYTAVKTVMPSRTLPIQQSSLPLPSGEPLLKKTFLVVFDGNCLHVTSIENFKVAFVVMVTNLTGIDSQLIEVLFVKCGSIEVVFSVLHNQASKIDEIFERLVNRGRFKVVFEGKAFQAFSITSIQSTTALPTSSHSSPTINVLSAKINERRLIYIIFVLFLCIFGALTMFGLVICIARDCGRRKSTKIRLKTGSTLSSRGTNQIYKNELELIRLSPLHRHADYYGGTPNSQPREDSDDEDNINNRTALLNMLRNGEIASRRGKITIKDDDSYSSIAFY